jgi:hypothetical protein
MIRPTGYRVTAAVCRQQRAVSRNLDGGIGESHRASMPALDSSSKLTERIVAVLLNCGLVITVVSLHKNV